MDLIVGFHTGFIYPHLPSTANFSGTIFCWQFKHEFFFYLQQLHLTLERCRDFREESMPASIANSAVFSTHLQPSIRQRLDSGIPSSFPPPTKQHFPSVLAHFRDVIVKPFQL
jgi:hypothetical protein